MTMNRNIGFAVILIVLGGLILLDKIGIGLGGLMSWIFPVILLVLGYYLIKNRRGGLGWPLIILGGIILFGKLAGLIGWIIAFILIAYGIHMLKNRRRTI